MTYLKKKKRGAYKLFKKPNNKMETIKNLHNFKCLNAYMFLK